MAKQSAQNTRTTKSLSFNLLVTFIVILLLVLSLMFWLTTQTLRGYLSRELDTNLKSSGQVIAAHTIDELASGRESQILPSDFYIYLAYEGAQPVSVVTSQVARTYGIPANVQTLAKTVTREPITVEGTSEATDWRIIPMQLASPTSNRQVGSVVIGLPTAGVKDAVWNLQRVLLPGMVLIIIAGAGIAYLLIRRSLRGLRDIEKATYEVADGNLSARVPVGKDGTEVASLGNSINAMLEQIEVAFAAKEESEERMRRFVSDASHELRTPLATVHGYAELYRIGGVPDDEVPHAMSRIESESNRMASLVEDLLQLARLDEGSPLHLTNVDLASVAVNTVSDFLVRAPERTAVVTDLEGGDIRSTFVVADPDRVTQVVTNLLSNVLSHTPVDTPVEVAAGMDPDDPTQAILEVRDHGPGVSAEDGEKIFQRFYRTDTSRSRSSGGSGLGLAIVSAIMAAHGGTARVHETPGGGLTVRLTFTKLGVPGQNSGADAPANGRANRHSQDSANDPAGIRRWRAKRAKQ